MASAHPGGAGPRLPGAVSILAPALSSFDPTEVNVDNRLAAPSGEHWLGVDGLGRDVFTRVLYGGRVSSRSPRSW